MSSRGIFILAITWIVMSPFWFWAENIALGIIWLCGGVIELFIALVRRSREKKSKKIPAYRDDTTIIFAWKKEFDEKEKNTFGMVN